jgi:hypothetical protein
MFAAVRRYSSVDRLVVDELANQAGALSAALSTAPGARGCDVISTRDGVIVIALGDDETSVIESGRRFAAWIERHVPALRTTSPEIWAGEVLIHGVGDESELRGDKA